MSPSLYWLRRSDSNVDVTGMSPADCQALPETRSQPIPAFRQPASPHLGADSCDRTVSVKRAEGRALPSVSEPKQLSRPALQLISPRQARSLSSCRDLQEQSIRTSAFGKAICDPKEIPLQAVRASPAKAHSHQQHPQQPSDQQVSHDKILQIPSIARPVLHDVRQMTDHPPSISVSTVSDHGAADLQPSGTAKNARPQPFNSDHGAETCQAQPAPDSLAALEPQAHSAAAAACSSPSQAMTRSGAHGVRLSGMHLASGEAKVTRPETARSWKRVAALVNVCA